MKWSDGPVTLENSQHKYYGIPEFGYLRWRHYQDGTAKTVYVHQLVAISEGEDPSDVFGKNGWVVHHGEDDRFEPEEAKCPLFNWGSNLKLEEDNHHANFHFHGIEKPTP